MKKAILIAFGVFAIGTFVSAASGGTYDMGTFNYQSYVNIGTSTSWGGNVRTVIVKEPAGNGTIATTTLMIGDAATTTSRSGIDMNNTSGAAECLYIVGTTPTVSSGVCK